MLCYSSSPVPFWELNISWSKRREPKPRKSAYKGKPENKREPCLSPRNRRRNPPVLPDKVATPTVVPVNQGSGKLPLSTRSGCPDYVPGLQIKKSTRWATEKVPSGPYQMPYVSRCGKFTGVSLGKFHMTPVQVVATTVATILSRIRHHVITHNSYGELVKHRRLILRSAYYYAVSHNSWFWDRVLFLTKNLEKNKNIIYSLSVKFMSKLDDYNRFVYSQVCSQTNWLLFRGRYPSARRDKSNYDTSKAFLSKSVSISIFFKKGLQWLQGRAFLHVAHDMTSLYGPSCSRLNHKTLVKGNVVKARAMGGPPSW